MFKIGDKIMIYEDGRLWPGCPIIAYKHRKGLKWIDSGVDFRGETRDKMVRTIDMNLLKKGNIKIRQLNLK